MYLLHPGMDITEATIHQIFYWPGIVSEINDTKEVPEVNFPINFKIIEKYQRKIPILLHKYKYSTHQKGSFCGGINIIINLIMCEDNIVIP